MKKLIHFVKLVWSVSPGYLLLLLCQSLVTGGQMMLNIILPKFLVDELLGGRQEMRLLALGAAVVLGNVGITFLSNTLKRILEEKQAFTVNFMNKIMAEKIMNLEYSCLENPYYLDLKERAVFAINNQDAISEVITCGAAAFSSFLTLAGLMAVIATLGP
ncbi:MAG: hypothetical protein HFH48_08405, partial [Lachnospiraceae bacterium]|nr:hypothetical protein [Lachnospiraceae bacterium]